MNVKFNINLNVHENKNMNAKLLNYSRFYIRILSQCLHESL